MTDERTRLDKWLWAARFYKTRSAATEAINGGKVDLNDDRARPAHPVKIGDTIQVRTPPYQHVLVVTGLADRRGSATAAAALFEETAGSKTDRERLREQLRLAPNLEFSGGKPSKKARRELGKLKGR
ncbi:MAG TPA: RNA-binding S4 domain-containing protein [Gemmatimonadales bacterium]|jgi:ribosome-associated heat shock protein Hsp15